MSLVFRVVSLVAVTPLEGLTRARRVAWVYPRPQGWFEEMYRNPVMFSLWKNDFRVSRETFDYICQLVGPYLSRQNAFKKSYSFEQTRQYCFVEIQQSQEMLLKIHDKILPK